MSGELAALWSWGFRHGGVVYPWGTLPAELPELDLRGGQEHGLPTIHRSAMAPHPERPVTTVLLQIAAEARLFEDAELDALRARLDADLGPGEHAPSPHGPEKANSTWRIDGASVRLTAYPSDWGFNWGRSSGRLYVTVDRERVATPYLDQFRAPIPPAEHDVIVAPGLRALPLDDLGMALSRPELRAAPDWVTLGRDEVAVWRSGFATRTFALPDPPALHHIRWAPARGTGYATLAAGPNRDLLVTYPGETGLDAVAARLAAHGIAVERTEEKDWG